MTDTTEKNTSNPTAVVGKPLVEELIAGMPFDGSMKRLEVHGEIPGYRLQWVNDRGSRVHTLIRYGFDFVKRDEIALNDRVIDGNQAVDDRVRRAVGGGSSGGEGATYAYLMKCPEELWQKFQDAMQVRPDNFDRMLLAGFANAGQNQYNPSHVVANKIDASDLMQPQAFPEVNQQAGGMRRPTHRMGGPSIRNR